MADIKSITVASEALAKEIADNYPNLLNVGAKISGISGGAATTLYNIHRWLDDNNHSHSVEHK